MAQHGIPPSPDRLEFQRTVIAGAVIVALVAGGLLYVFMRRDTTIQRLDTGTSRPAAYSADAYAEEVVRAAAYAALREYIDREARGPGVVGVYCRDSSHRLKGDYIEFRGEVDLEGPGGYMDRQTYTATLQRDGRSGWKVVSYVMRDAPDLRAYGGSP